MHGCLRKSYLTHASALARCPVAGVVLPREEVRHVKPRSVALLY